MVWSASKVIIAVDVTKLSLFRIALILLLAIRFPALPHVTSRGEGGRAFGSFEVFFGVVHPALPSSSTEACALGGHLEMQAWFLK